MIRIMSITGEPTCDGETCGRALLSDALRAALRDGHGAGMRPANADMWDIAQMAMACLWLGRAITAAGEELGVNPLEVVPAEGGGGLAFRGWEHAHQFLAGQPPFVHGGGVEICCRGCLGSMAASLATEAAFLAAATFRGDYGMALAHVRAGGPVPPERGPEDGGPAATMPDIPAAANGHCH